VIPTAKEVLEVIAASTAAGEFLEVCERDIGGRRHKIYKHAAETVIALLQSARNYGDAEFIVYEDQRLSYREFFERADAFAAMLQKRFDVHKGDRVAIAMRNSPQWAIAFVAATLVGAIVVPINSWGKAEELSIAITNCGAKCVAVDFARYQLIADRIADFRIDVFVTEAAELPTQSRVFQLDDIVGRGRSLAYDIDTASATDTCIILYTSGSTGFPKGVPHQHIAICQALMNMLHTGMVLMRLEGLRELKGGATRETPMLTVPLFHATGLLTGFLLPLQMGQKIVIMRKWDAVKALQLIEAEKITSLSTVPAILKDFLGHPEFDRYNTSSLSRVGAGGAATPAGLPELIEEKLGEVSRSAGYGMTETMAVTASTSGVIFSLKPLSSGPISPIMQIRFTDAEDRVLPPGESGEIQLRGITCMVGYWEKPEATREVFTADGWFKTGDVGCIDNDGFLHITGRIKEMVIRGGENIYPIEIEQAAYKHAAVKEVVVFGVDDAAMGEELGMVCHLANDEHLSEDGLRKHLASQLAGFKVPKYIAFSSEPLPRNASEKLHKLRVREEFFAGCFAVSDGRTT